MKVQKILLGMVIAGASLSVFGAVEGEVAFTLNTFAFLIFGALVMWMCAGFTMLEAGSVRTKNASVICMKNIGLYSIAGLMYYIIGYNVMYGDGTPFFGAFEIGFQSSEAEGALFHGDADASIDTVLDDSSYSAVSGWFFQMVFVATTASIISGALAERVRLISFFMFVIVLTGLLYPIVGKWTWGGGWLIDMGFVDFAGSTIVHSTGGWAALAGVIIVGARSGKFLEDGSVRATPPSNVPIVTLGVFILWLGWFGFNGGSQLALGSGLDAISMGVILVNTNLAAASGCLIAMALSRPVLGRLDLFATLNGAIAGLVAITAAPNFVDHIWAIPVGAVGGAICVLGMKALDLLKLDDVVGAIPAHLFAGIWGTLAASFTVGASFVAQLTGIVAIGVMVFVVGFGVWMIINLIFGVRVSERTEQLGQDVAELGIEAYPEFVVVPDEQIIGPDK